MSLNLARHAAPSARLGHRMRVSLTWLLLAGCAEVTSVRATATTQTATTQTSAPSETSAVTSPGRLDEPLADPLAELARLRRIATEAAPQTAHAALERILAWHRVALRSTGRDVEAGARARDQLREDEQRLLSPGNGVEALSPLDVAALDPALYTHQPDTTRSALVAWLAERARRAREPGGFWPAMDDHTLAALGPFFASLPIDLYAQLYAADVVSDDARFDEAAIDALTLRDRHALFAVAERRARAGDRRRALYIASRLVALDTWDLQARILRVALAHATDGPLPLEVASISGYETHTLLRVALDLGAGRLAPDAQPSERLALALRMMVSRRPEAALAVLDAIDARGEDAEAVRTFVRGWILPGALDDMFGRACSPAEREVVFFGLVRCRTPDAAPAIEAAASEAARPSEPAEEALAYATLARVARMLADGELDTAEAMLEHEGTSLPMVMRVGMWLALRDARAPVVPYSSAEPWSWEHPQWMNLHPRLPTAARLARDLSDVLAMPTSGEDTITEASSPEPSGALPQARATRFDDALRGREAPDPETLVELVAELPDDEAAFLSAHALVAAAGRGDRRLARTIAVRLSALRSTSVYPLIGRLALAMLDDAPSRVDEARRALDRILPGGFEATYDDPYPSPAAPLPRAPAPTARCEPATVSETDARLSGLLRRARYVDAVAALRLALDTPCAARVLDDAPTLRAVLPELGDAALVLSYLHDGVDWTFVTRDDASEPWRAVALEDFRAGRLDRETAANIIDARTAIEGYELSALGARFPRSHALMLAALDFASHELDLARGGSRACGTATACRALALRVLARDADDPMNVAYGARVLGALGDAANACQRLAQALVANADDAMLLEAHAIVCEDPSATAPRP